MSEHEQSGRVAYVTESSDISDPTSRRLFVQFKGKVFCEVLNSSVPFEHHLYKIRSEFFGLREAMRLAELISNFLCGLDEWSSIEPPKDGTEILAYFPRGDKIEIVAWTSDGAGGMAWCSARCVDGLAAGDPSRWMPMPPKPAAESTE